MNKPLLGWLLSFVIWLQSLYATPIIKALFSPDDHPTATLVELINRANKRIYAAVYFLTDKTIAQALINAQRRQIEICLILDPISSGKFGKASLLEQHNVPVYIYNNKLKPLLRTINKNKLIKTTRTNLDDTARWFSEGPIMHHKFAIIDSRILWTGSFNWTGAANTKNQENIVIIYDETICKTYEQQFIKLLHGYTEAYKPGIYTTHKVKNRNNLLVTPIRA